MAKKDPYQFRKVMVCLDGSDDSVAAFKYAIHKLRGHNECHLILCSVMEETPENFFKSLEPSFVYGEREDLVRHLKHYKKIARQYGVKHVRIVIDKGIAGETIVKHVLPHIKPDLLVIGSKCKKGVAKHFGSQASYMAKYADVPVMIIR